jgi:Domain of unknown function (DUF4157)/Bacterial toxin 5
VSSASPKSRETGSMPRTAAPEQETRSAPENPANDAVKSLQRDAGNQGVSRLMAGSSGRPLDPGMRKEMETKFSADFGDVRIHSDRAAAETALNAGARAIAAGDDIAFGPGFYAPTSGTGRRLLAHELAHVIQQKGHGDRAVCEAAAESEARQAGADVSAGQTPSVRGAVSAGAQADGMTKEEIKKQIAELETKAFATKDSQASDRLYQQRQALMQKLHDLELFPSLPPPQSIAPPSAKARRPDISVRKTALEIGEHELDRPAWPGFSFDRKPSGPRDLTSVREIVRQGTPLRKSVAITHWRSRAEVEQFMQDYITVADEDPATKPQADQARRDRKAILRELDTAEEDVLAGRLKLAEGEQHAEDITAMMRVQVPEVLKPGIAAAEVVGIGGTQVVDALLDFVPYLGEVKMLLEAATGMTISGQLNRAVYAPEELGTPDLDALDRIMRILPLAIAGASKIASHAPGWAEALAKLRKGTSLSEQALQTAISDTAKLAGREQEVAHALLEAQKRARAAASLEERAGLLEQKPAAGHDVQTPAVKRPVASADGMKRPDTGTPVAQVNKGPAPAPAPVGAAAKAPRKSFRPEMREALANASDPDHPLHKLTEQSKAGSKTPRQFRKVARVTESGKAQTGRYHAGETGPVVQAGHADAYASGASQRFVLEDADLNQVSGNVIESKGAYSSKEALFVTKPDGTGGVWVEAESLKQWERLEVVPPGTVDAAVKRTASLTGKP